MNSFQVFDLNITIRNLRMKFILFTLSVFATALVMRSIGKPIETEDYKSAVLGIVDTKWSPGQSGGSVYDTEPMMIDAGTDLEVSCLTAEAGGISWTYPSKHVPVEDLPYHGQVEITESYSVDDSLYYSTLRVFNATYRDTGRYRCYCSSLTDLVHSLGHSGNRLVKKLSLHVYVKDTENMFQIEPLGYRESVMAVVRRSVVLPCAVTNPYIDIQLYKDYGYGKERLVHIDSKHITFDPRLGYTFERIGMMDSGAYTCRATEGDSVQEKRFLMFVLPSAPLILDPVLSLASGEKLVSGDDITLKCQVPIGRMQTTTITWWKTDGNYTETKIEEGESDRIVVDEPELEDICSGGRDKCSFTSKYSSDGPLNPNYVKLAGKMKIKNSQPSDTATYFCRVWSSGLTVTSNRIGVYVLQAPEVQETTTSSSNSVTQATPPEQVIRYGNEGDSDNVEITLTP